MKSKRPVIQFDELQRGYELTFDNAMRFFGAATDLKDYPDKALALAQLGQEEVGRTLTLLAAFALPPDEGAWQWFWKGWANHTVKGHRAYLYEIISPLRLESVRSDGSRYAGSPLRSSLSQEKEAGFYVDFDQVSNAFTSPATHVTKEEAAFRLSTLTYLLVTADAVRRVILHKNTCFRFGVFGALAFRICSENLYQQDMPRLAGEFRRLSEHHQEAFDDLDIALAGNLDFLTTHFMPKG